MEDITGTGAAGKVPIAAQKILDRDLSGAITRDVRHVGRPLLREVVDEGIRVFERCSKSAKGRDENIGLLFPFLQLIELLDGAEVVLDGSSVVGSNPILRAALEALLTVEWVARDSDLRYGAAYVVCDVHRRITSHQQYAEGHEKRRQLLTALEADDFVVPLAIPLLPDAADKIAGLEALLQAPHLAAAEIEYQATRAKMRGGSPRFHALWDGPGNIEQLAAKLGRAGYYQILYRQWSLTGHADDVLRQLTHVDGAAALRPFRSGTGLGTTYAYAVQFGVYGIRALLKFYRKEELGRSFQTWYKTHVLSAMRALTPSA
jgi:hypothetical protein